MIILFFCVCRWRLLLLLLREKSTSRFSCLLKIPFPSPAEAPWPPEGSNMVRAAFCVFQDDSACVILVSQEPSSLATTLRLSGSPRSPLRLPALVSKCSESLWTTARRAIMSASCCAGSRETIYLEGKLSLRQGRWRHTRNSRYGDVWNVDLMHIKWPLSMDVKCRTGHWKKVMQCILRGLENLIIDPFDFFCLSSCCCIFSFLSEIDLVTALSTRTFMQGEVYVLTQNEGGRHTPFFNNYR